MGKKGCYGVSFDLVARKWRIEYEQSPVFGVIVVDAQTGKVVGGRTLHAGWVWHSSVTSDERAAVEQVVDGAVHAVLN
jgi:hypothetical protein